MCDCLKVGLLGNVTAWEIQIIHLIISTTHTHFELLPPPSARKRFNVTCARTLFIQVKVFPELRGENSINRGKV